MQVQTPANWGVTGASFGPCSDAGSVPMATGALGTLAFRSSGTLCAADLHVTLFGLTAAGVLQTTRLDVDGLVVPNLPASYCK